MFHLSEKLCMYRKTHSILVYRIQYYLCFQASARVNLRMHFLRIRVGEILYLGIQRVEGKQTNMELFDLPGRPGSGRAVNLPGSQDPGIGGGGGVVITAGTG